MRTAARVISWGSSILGVLFLVAFLPGDAESQTAGIGLSLGVLGFPTTFAGYWFLEISTSEGTLGNHILDALVIAACYFGQWQMVAYLIRRIAKRKEKVAIQGAG